MDLSFIPLLIGHGLLTDPGDIACSVRVYGWREEDLSLPDDATHFGMVMEGKVEITDAHGTVRLTAGMYFVVPGPCRVRPIAPSAPRPFPTKGIVVVLANYHGLRQFGGPVTGEGRLRYIDGCSDTLLACPPRRGEPCLNYLHVPPGTRQSAHTHPSDRIGVILRGRGECHTPGGAYPLSPGMAWRIPAGALHAFATRAEPLEILAWHPDSDFGPTDADHPMLNRTIRPG